MGIPEKTNPPRRPARNQPREPGMFEIHAGGKDPSKNDDPSKRFRTGFEMHAQPRDPPPPAPAEERVLFSEGAVSEGEVLPVVIDQEHGLKTLHVLFDPIIDLNYGTVIEIDYDLIGPGPLNFALQVWWDDKPDNFINRVHMVNSADGTNRTVRFTIGSDFHSIQRLVFYIGEKYVAPGTLEGIQRKNIGGSMEAELNIRSIRVISEPEKGQGNLEIQPRTQNLAHILLKPSRLSLIHTISPLSAGNRQLELVALHGTSS